MAARLEVNIGSWTVALSPDSLPCDGISAASEMCVSFEAVAEESPVSSLLVRGVYSSKIEFFINHYLDALSFLWSEMPISG